MTRSHRLIALALLLANAFCYAATASTEEDTVKNSNLDGELFYRLLVSELSAQNGDAASAYALMLDTARKANSPRLFERAIEMALMARSGESALQASQAWARAFPASREANRYVLQILIGLNRNGELLEPLKRDLAGLNTSERSAAIAQLPRYFARTNDKATAAAVVEQALAADINSPQTGPSAWATVGRLHLMAGNAEGALDAVRRGVALNPKAEEPIALALILVGPQAAAAEPLIAKHLSEMPTPNVRMAYARKLVEGQRFADAYLQVQRLTQEKPDFEDAWLLQGSLEAQDKKWAQAEASLQTYVGLSTRKSNDTGSDIPMGRDLVQATILLAQIAEQSQQWDKALTYLASINSPQDALSIQGRKAMIYSRQGKLNEARSLIRNIPEQQTDDARSKITLEVQVLRDNKRYLEAFQLLADAVARDPKDMDFAYDQAMMAEKLGKLDEMESLLRRVIAAKPDYHHAYNALGYSLADRKVQLSEARQLIKKALEFAPTDPYILDSLAWVEFRSGNASEALRILQGAYQARPDAEIAAHLGEVLWSLGQQNAAADIWKQGLGLNPTNETLLETMRRFGTRP